jgi:hypothetical protein
MDRSSVLPPALAGRAGFLRQRLKFGMPLALESGDLPAVDPSGKRARRVGVEPVAVIGVPVPASAFGQSRRVNRPSRVTTPLPFNPQQSKIPNTRTPCRPSILMSLIWRPLIKRSPPTTNTKYSIEGTKLSDGSRSRPPRSLFLPRAQRGPYQACFVSVH